MKNKKKIIARQKYTFEILHYDNNTLQIRRNNKGFTVMEIIAIGSLIQKNNIEKIFNPYLKNTKKDPLIPIIRKP